MTGMQAAVLMLAFMTILTIGAAISDHYDRVVNKARHDLDHPYDQEVDR